MYDLATTVQPWVYGKAYQDAVIASYQAAGGVFDADLFNTSLMCLAFHFSKHYARPIDKMEAHLRMHVLPALT